MGSAIEFLGEPTNDLDTDTLAAMEDLLDGWPGTLIVVSHDRYLLERVTDHQVALLGDGKLRALPGGVEQYLRIRAGKEPAPQIRETYRGRCTAESAATAGASTAGHRAAVQTSQSRAAPAGQASSAAEQRQARKTMQRVEKQMERLSDRQAQLHQQMADASEAMDLERLRHLQAELDEVTAELADAEEAWLQASEIAET